MRGSSEARLGNRSGDARDLGGGIAAGGGAHPVPQGGLRVSLPNASALRLPEASQGRGGAAAGVPAMHHEAHVGARLPATYLANGHLYDLPTSRAHARVLGTMAAQYASADRPPPQAAPGGPPELGSRRIDGSRRPRKKAWGLSRQRRRRGHPVPIHVPREAHLRELPVASPETSDGIVTPFAVQGFHSDNGSG